MEFCQEGCGCNECMGRCADVLECITPIAESSAKLICCLGSPLAFPLIFCFDSDPHTHESSGWNITMMQTPSKASLACCLSTICVPCGQFYVRKYAVLNGDMSKYKLWQGKHDGPHCLANYCKGAPCTIESGSYGEQKCPNAFLCAEVTCLGCGLCSPCCAFDVSRDMMKEERGLGTDPVEARFDKCQGFFGELMGCAACAACQLRILSCCLGSIATESEGAQELSGEARRLSSACARLSQICFRGLISVKIIAMGCMSAQMVHEQKTVEHLVPKYEVMQR
uniref:Uncharacterized protein n=1 Tax=Chaetoceros debilis TaxID=122233 RepID=A0A7S3V5Q2_9STRA|mmetsp:Transcript_14057/g.20456  ORF Transcript_14057/g.20456 Transcript_14057/m.20456 type:complete len:281 (-) Transcript_14057:198-1040(-)